MKASDQLDPFVCTDSDSRRQRRRRRGSAKFPPHQDTRKQIGVVLALVALAAIAAIAAFIFSANSQHRPAIHKSSTSGFELPNLSTR